MLQSEVFMREDLAAILRAIASTAAASNDGASPHDAAFRRGFVVALGAVATAVHITPDELRIAGSIWQTLAVRRD